MLQRVFTTSICFAILIAIAIVGPVFAADKPTVQEKMIGGTFKTLAKAYVATANIEKLKEQNVQRIESMKSEWFHKKYAEVYEVARTLPPKIKGKYGVTEKMTKDGAIRIVKALDKNKLYEIIENVPDPVIAAKFHEHLKGDEKAGSQGSLTERVGKVWEKIVQTLNRPAPQKK